MKYLFALLTALILLIATIALLLFTQPGNDLLRPFLEKKIGEEVPISTKLETFVLRPDRFHIALQFGDETHVETVGQMDLLAQSIDATYAVRIAKLEDLQSLIGTRLNGPLEINGTVEGDRKKILVQGLTDIAQSSTEYRLTLRNLRPDTLSATVKHLHIEKLLYMIDQPIYAKGFIDIEADLPGLDPAHLKGSVLTKISHGFVNAKPVYRELNLSIPQPFRFSGDIDTRLAGTQAISRVDFLTTVADLHSKTVTYDLATGLLSSDYTLRIPDLDRLFFLVGRHLKGDLTVTGDVKAGKETLFASAHADTLGGAFDARVRNDKVTVKIKNIQTVALTDMLLYPHIFDSRANANLDYDIQKQAGTLHAELLNGQILPNKMSFMLQQMANFDITREIYKRTTLDTTIAGKLLTNDLYMKSRLTEIVSKNGKIDLDKQTIDTTLEIKIRKSFIPVHLKGALTDPEVKIDAKALLQSKAKEELKKHLPKEIEKSPAADLLKNLF